MVQLLLPSLIEWILFKCPQHVTPIETFKSSSIHCYFFSEFQCTLQQTNMTNLFSGSVVLPENISIIGVAILRGSCYSKAGGHLLCSIYFYIVKFFGALIFSLSRAPFLGNILILSKHMIDGAWHNGLVAKVIALNAPGSNMGASSSPGSLVSHPIPSFWPGKAVKDTLKPWDSAPE